MLSMSEANPEPFAAMRGPITTEASLSTRVSVWWGSIPFCTGALLATCVTLHVVILLGGFDVLSAVCFSGEGILNGRVYTIFTSVLFHGGLLHLVFNMMAFVPMGGSIERQLGSVRYTYLVLLFTITNAVLAILIAAMAAMPFLPLYPNLIYECSIGFSGIIFSLIVVETYTTGAQNLSIFGFFSVPAKWYPWVLLLIFQLLIPNVSLLGHLSGLLSGLAYSYGMFTFLVLPSTFYNAIESSSFLAPLVRRPNFIVGGSFVNGSLPTLGSFGRVSRSAAESADSAWRRVRGLLTSQETSTSESPNNNTQDSLFPGEGRVLGRSTSQSTTGASPILPSRYTTNEPLLSKNGVPGSAGGPAMPLVGSGQIASTDGKALSQLVAMGFDQTAAAAALSVAKGDLSMAIELLGA